MSFVTARDGTRLYWREWGEGAPMLFLSGLGIGNQMWDYQMAAFADQGFRCIGLDRRGHGRSDQPGHGYDIDTLADDVAILIDTLDLTDLTFVAHSMGACEVVRYLTRHGSDRVARVVLLGGTTPMLLKTADNPGGAPREEFERVWAQWRRDYPAWVAEETEPFFVPDSSPAMMRWAVALLQQISLPVALACARTMVEVDLRDEMRRLTVPTLVIHGDRDRSAPIDLTGKPSAQLIPDCRFIIYEGAPHGLLYTHMDRLHADVLEFVREPMVAAR